MTFTEFVKKANLEADEPTEQLISPRTRLAASQQPAQMPGQVPPQAAAYQPNGQVSPPGFQSSITDAAGGPKTSPLNGSLLENDDDPTVVAGPRLNGGMAPAPYHASHQAPPAVAGMLMNDDGETAEKLLYRQPRNPEEALVVCAQPLLALVAELKKAVEFADVTSLRRFVVSEIDTFEERALKADVQAGEVTAARYVLCALIDETILTTPWGSRSEWSANSLLNEFHGETWGGEKVFEILERVRRKSGEYFSLIRLIDVCLLLGFEGRYRIVEGGRYQLEDLRADLGRSISGMQDPPPKELAPNVTPAVARGGLRSYVPLWVVFAASAVVLVAIFGLFNFLLSTEISPLVSDIDTLNSRLLEQQ